MMRCQAAEEAAAAGSCFLCFLTVRVAAAALTTIFTNAFFFYGNLDICPGAGILAMPSSGSSGVHVLRWLQCCWPCAAQHRPSWQSPWWALEQIPLKSPCCTGLLKLRPFLECSWPSPYYLTIFSICSPGSSMHQDWATETLCNRLLLIWALKIVICPLLNQLEFSLDILLRNLALFYLKAMGFLLKQGKLSQLLKTRPGWVRILWSCKGIHFWRHPFLNLIAFKKGKFQKVKILTIFWRTF